MSGDKFWTFFFEIYESLPRQGPGERASTERALKLLPPLRETDRILDIGCGSGAQTLDLARATAAQITAVDNHRPFLEQLGRRATEAGFGSRIATQVADMSALPYPDSAFDVLWCEGAIFIVGFERGLRAWRRLLKPGGYAVISESCWLQPEPVEELRELFFDGFDEVGDAEARRRSAAAAGYRVIADFVLPVAGWSENYHAPLAESLKSFRAAHADDPEALAVATRCEREIALYRQHADTYGYVFFVLQPDEGSHADGRA